MVPFAAAYETLRGAVQSANDAARHAQDSKCEAKLNSAYPEASAKLRGVLQRELKPKDLEEQLVAALRMRMAAQVVAVEIPVDPHSVPGTQQLLDTAAHQGLAYLTVVELLNAYLAPLDSGCEQWALRLTLEVSLWNTADGTRVRGPLFSYPHVDTGLDTFKAVMDEPGALRMRIVPNLGRAADDIALGLTP